MERSEFASATWRKSNLSNDGNCVEVAYVPDQVGVRDTKNRDGDMLTFSTNSWRVFLDGVRAGEFDR